MSTTTVQPAILPDGYEITNIVVVDENFNPDHTSEQDVVDKLKARFKDFKIEVFLPNIELFQKLAEGQDPKVMLITCIDSRCNPTMLFGLEAGEAFVVRNVANFVHPYEGQHVAHENAAVGAAIEFAVTVMDVKHIVVVGHSSCGGIKALMTRDDFTTDLVGNWVKVGLPAKEKVKQLHPELSFDEQVSLCEKEAVNVSLKNLLTYPYVKERVKGGGLHIHGMHYNLRHGRLTSWDIVRK
jgi:carbonic anhydrase